MKDFSVRKVNLETWKALAEKAHLVLFGETGQAEVSTVSYALLGASDEELFSYATIIEIDAHTAHIQHGGALPNIRGTISSKRCYTETVNWLKAHYKRITTRIHHKNVAMLKFALSEGLIIRGLDFYKDGIYLHLDWGFE